MFFRNRASIKINTYTDSTTTTHLMAATASDDKAKLLLNSKWKIKSNEKKTEKINNYLSIYHCPSD